MSNGHISFRYLGSIPEQICWVHPMCGTITCRDNWNEVMRSTAFLENQLYTRVVDIVDIGYKIESLVGVGVLVR